MKKAVKQLPIIPDNLKKWLTREYKKIYDISIYEMKDWTQSIKNKEIYQYKETIYNTISIILLESNKKLKIEWENKYKQIFLVKANNTNIFILYEKLPRQRVILYSIFQGETPKESDIERLLKKYEYGLTNKEVLVQGAKKAYSEYVLTELKLWSDIQEDSIANLALSPEEKSILENASFPIFINGQAGSGKSTLLYYLFAYFCTIKDKEIPLFLTYSKPLLKKAQDVVKSILEKNIEYNEKNYDNERISEMFKPFQPFVLNKLLDKKGKEKFKIENYISYEVFRKCYLSKHEIEKLNCKLPERNKISPELSWHIIRTYIKGYSYDFSPQDFIRLPRKEKSVSEEKYKEVFNTIWNKWYKKFSIPSGEFNHGLWDDQDLIHYVLNNWNPDIHFPVIFCDEAQDFTRIEIELLLKLLTFMKYDLTGVRNIPICFAGDPYQTINPTGFRWEIMKTVFNNKFKELNPLGIDIKFEQLSQNYRSKPPVIKFSNYIQAYRYLYLDIKELKPQATWNNSGGVSPFYFIIDENISFSEIASKADKTIIIVPSEKEVNFKRDKLISSFDNNKNIFSVIDAKGLEFNKVIVYRFGENVPSCFEQSLTETLLDSEYAELAHFFNKLYVAISRTRNYLFIIDTKEGFNKFWCHFTESKLFDPLKNKTD